MSDGYFTLDEQWRFSLVNPSLAKLLGTPGRDLVGASFWDEVTDSIHSNFFKHLPGLLTGATQVEFTEFHAPTRRWFSVRANHSGGLIVVFLRDVTAEHER
jgi:PAS domain-containing protein